jgi:hypothetical protein
MDSLRPLVFLDFDDVLCVNSLYGGYDVLAPNPPAEMWGQLFHAPAVQTLQGIVDEFAPRMVITTSWLRFMERQGFEQLFGRTGLGFVADSLHEAWEAPQDRGTTRPAAVERWLSVHHKGEPFVVLDDIASGTGLAGSALDKHGRVVLCQVGVGLHRGHLSKVRGALSK